MIICILEQNSEWDECRPYFIDTSLLEDSLIKALLEKEKSYIYMCDPMFNIFSDNFGYEDFNNYIDSGLVYLPQMVEKYLTLHFDGVDVFSNCMKKE